ncbi:MAG: DUF502 domain-containing protein [Pleurocapsa sp. MO_192.B19]|nr:DUF502 domain-containing protein [Pleurocapsa sp. MO_192.B19]
MLQRLKQDLKSDLIAGLLVVIPLATTIWLSISIAKWAIDLFTRIPKQINPFDGLNPFLTTIINFSVGLAVPLLSILIIGLMARNIVGRWLLDFGEQLLQAIPLAGSVYKTLKQILETLLGDSKTKFRRVVMIEYPRKGVWTMGFVTGKVSPPLQSHLVEEMISVFIPTTPNPTSGWYAIVPKEEAIDIDISIEDAFKVLISGGIVSPETPAMKPPLSIPKSRKKVPLESTFNTEKSELISVEEES